MRQVVLLFHCLNVLINQASSPAAAAIVATPIQKLCDK